MFSEVYKNTKKMCEEILNGAQEFLASDIWWSQILDFMLSKCEPFKTSNSYTFEEYKIYQEYVAFLEKLIDVDMCKQLDISPGNFEDAIMRGIEKGNATAISLKDILVHAFDFPSFCSDMIAHNERIEQEVESVMRQDYDANPVPENNQINNNPRFAVHEPEQMRTNVSPPSPTNIMPPLQNFQVVPPNNPPSPHEIRTPRNPRCIQNRLSIALPMAIARRAGMKVQYGGGPAALPAILSRKKETLQTMQSGMPTLKIPKAGPIKLPPLGKSPRF